MIRLDSLMTIRNAGLMLALAGVAAGANPKVTPGPAGGVKTPGVLIPFERLKAEAEIGLGSAPAGFAFTGDAVVVGESRGVVRRFDAKTNKAFEPSRDGVDVKQPCGGFASGFASLWTATCGDAPALAKMDQPEARPARRGRPDGAKPEMVPPEAVKPEAVKPEAVKAKPTVLSALDAAPVARVALAASEDSLWLLADGKTTLLRMDPETGAAVADVRLPAACSAVLYAEGALWVACPAEAKLLRIDAKTNLVEKRIEVPAEPFALAAGEGSIWVYSRKDGKVSRVDVKTNKAAAAIELGLPGAEVALAFGEGYLWASAPGYPVMRIAPATDKVVQQFYGLGGGRIAAGAGSIWVGSGEGKTVLRLDPRRIQATLAE